MEKTNPSYPLRRYREGGGEEINPQYHETWYREILTPKGLDLLENVLKRWIPTPSSLRQDAGGGRDQRRWKQRWRRLSLGQGRDNSCMPKRLGWNYIRTIWLGVTRLTYPRSASKPHLIVGSGNEQEHWG
jgi:hypothetical protein